MATKSDDTRTSAVDEELKKLLEARKAEIKVVGIGGAGNNTVSRMMQVGIVGAEVVALNTDAQDLLYTDANTKVLIGKELTRGLGAGANPHVGMESAKESKGEIKGALEGADMVFITCGLGGGTGTGAAPVVADIAKKMGALTVGVVTLPFTMEGKQRMDNARHGLEDMEKMVDTLIVIPNDKLLEIVPDVSIITAFKVSDEILVNSVKGIAELVTGGGDRALSQAAVSNNVMRLSSLDRFPMDGKHLLLAYEESKSFIEYIINEYGENRLLQLLEYLKGGNSLNVSFEKAYSVSFHDLEQKWVNYLQRKYTWFSYVSSNIYTILFFLAGVITLYGFFRLLQKKRDYKDEEEERDKLL